MYEYRALVARVVDGDTVDLKVDCGFHIYHTVRVRLAGLNAPEMKTQEGKDSKAWLMSHLPPDTEVIVKTFKDKQEKYGRLLGVILKDLTNLNEELVKAGHATEYDGGKR